MTSIILDLPYAYEVRLIPPGKRNFGVHLVRDFTPVMVPTASSDDAPLALVVEMVDPFERSNPGDRAAFYPHGPERIEYRAYDGRLYRPLNDRSPVRVDDFQAAVREPGAWRGRLRPTAPIFQASMYPRLPALGRDSGNSALSLPSLDEALAALAPGKARIVGGELTRRKAEGQDLLSKSILVVDDTVWTTAHAGEPTYRLISTHGRVEIDLVLHADALAYVSTFRLDDLDGARRMAAAEAARLNPVPEVRETINRVQVLLPDALRRENAVMTAEQALRGLALQVTNRQQFEQWPEEIEQLDNHLRSLRGKKDLSLADAVEILGLLDEFTMTMVHSPSAGRYARETIEGTAMALRRWHDIELPRRPDLQQMLTEQASDSDVLGL